MCWLYIIIFRYHEIRLPVKFITIGICSDQIHAALVIYIFLTRATGHPDNSRIGIWCEHNNMSLVLIKT